MHSSDKAFSFLPSLNSLLSLPHSVGAFSWLPQGGALCWSTNLPDKRHLRAAEGQSIYGLSRRLGTTSLVLQTWRWYWIQVRHPVSRAGLCFVDTVILIINKYLMSLLFDWQDAYHNYLRREQSFRKVNIWTMFPNCCFSFCFVTAFNLIANCCCSPLIYQQSHIPAVEPHHIQFPILPIAAEQEGEYSDGSWVLN